jgi:hypothetical protein
MKKLTALAIALSFGIAAPVFACPATDAANAKTAKKTQTEKKDTAQKDAAAKAKPAETAKKTADKVSMK